MAVAERPVTEADLEFLCGCVWHKPPELETIDTHYINFDTGREWKRSDRYIIQTPIRLYRLPGTERYFAVDAFHEGPPQEVEDLSRITGLPGGWSITYPSED